MKVELIAGLRYSNAFILAKCTKLAPGCIINVSPCSSIYKLPKVFIFAYPPSYFLLCYCIQPLLPPTDITPTCLRLLFISGPKNQLFLVME